MIPKFVFEIHIHTTPEKLWDALINADATEQYYFGSRFESDLTPGSPYSYNLPDGSSLLDGEIIEAKPFEKLVMTFRPLFNGESKELNTSRTTFTIDQEGETCKLVLSHDELAESDTVEGYAGGWSRIFSGLKTLLETGEPLRFQTP